MMHLILTDPNGNRMEGLVLAVGANRIRFVTPAQKDAIELRRAHGQWSSDIPQTLQLDAILHDGQTDLVRFVADLFPPEQAIGGTLLLEAE